MGFGSLGRLTLGRMGSGGGGVAPPQTIWFDDFSTYADTAEMIAGGWVEDAGTILLQDEKLRLDASAESARAGRAITGLSDGDIIKVTYDLPGTSLSGVSISPTISGTPFASGTSTTGTGYTMSYTVSGVPTVYVVFRRNTSAGTEVFADNVLVQLMNPQ
jgi:hypothetical protein